MNENEKLVWAAVYAKHWTGTEVATHTPTAIENAWAAVVDMREAQDRVADGWGEDGEVYLFLQEMLSDER